MRWGRVEPGLGLARRACAPLYRAPMAMCQRRYSAARENASPAPSWSRSVFRVLAWVPVVMFVTSHVCSVANVHGHSMSPTFNPINPEQFGHPSERPSSDIVLLNRTVTTRRNYRRGDIVTLYCPNDPNRLITKRILALGGDTVRVWVPRGMDLAPASSENARADVVSLAYTNMYQKALRELASEIEDHASGAWLSITIPPQYAWVEGDAIWSGAPGSRHITRGIHSMAAVAVR
ncbi:hypothetical protein MCAP1_003244 [Malassezia caprae]|uniref:Peptidase S26 domain-containing protein n=1 Tax=Malassezia caprae TaxID=1381934 RepID=A0AAF0E9U4_9BASI|nr:hypothetical protein MCAP1_003244 [Malassezia caprae]